MKRVVLAGVVVLGACAPVPPPEPPPNGCEDAHELDELGPNECPMLAETIELDQVIYRSIATASDEDWYLLPETRRSVYELEIDGTFGEVVDANGAVVASGVTAVVTPVLPPPLYLRVTAPPGSGPGRQNYFMVVRAHWPDDHPNVFDELGVTAQAGVAGVIDYPGDTDAFRVTLPARRRLKVSMRNPELADIYTLLKLPDGRTRDVTRMVPVTFTVQEQTTAELIVQCVNPYSCYFSDQSWIWTLEDLGPDDASDDFFLTALVTSSASGVLDEPDDHDWYRLAPMEEGHFYFLDVTGPVRALVFELNGDGIAASPTVFRGQPRERRLLITGSQPGAWSLRLVDTGLDDVPNTVEGARPLDPDVLFTGRFEEPNDIDAFLVPTVQNHFYVASVDIPQANATFIDGFGRETKGPTPLFVRADRSGPMPLLVTRQFPPTPVVTYGLTVNDLGADELAESLAAEVPIDGGELSGRFQAPIDVDAFTVQSADLVEVRVASTHGGSARVELTDGGSFIRAGDAGITFSMRPDRARRIELRPASRAPIGMPYSVTASPVSDDFDEERPVAATIGTALYGNIEFADDVDVFSFDMTTPGPFRVHITPGCVHFTLVRPDRTTTGLWSGNGLYAYQSGRYFLHARAERCESVAYGFTVTVP